MNIDLYEIVFEVILGLEQCPVVNGASFGCITGNVAQDLLYAFFIPHVVLLVFLTMIFKGVSESTGSFGGNWLEILLILSGYLFVIGLEWYPMVASLSAYWLVIVMLGGLFYFFTARIFGKGTGNDGIAKSIGEEIGKKYKRSLEASYNHGKIDKFIERLEDDLTDPSLSNEEREKAIRALRAAKRMKRRG